jgi:arabinan endo-1,5-alpha-L-arabinosidase
MKIGRRRFVQQGAIMSAGLVLDSNGWSPMIQPMSQLSVTDDLTGNFRPVHDPAIIKDGDTYFLFCTGPRTPIRSSTDLMHWELRGDVFSQIPDWAREAIPRADSIWAPDIAYYNSTFHLYYSVSTFGSNRSVIGLATNATLDPDSSDYAWTDDGLVVESQRVNDYNAIDPNVIVDEDGIPWLAFGSHWSGIKMRLLDPETGKPSTEDESLYPLASRAAHPRAVEAPYIIRRGDFYYLFVSFDACCRGITSTYRVMVGRSEQVTGPYVDRDDVPMLEDGGTQVTYPSGRWRGPGHCAILQENDTDTIVYHAYDGQLNGLPTLRVDALVWDDEAWPAILLPEGDESND